MIHKIADLSKLKVIAALYHRTFMTNPNPTLVVTVDGKKQEFFIRWRAASRDKLYHSNGLPCILIVYDDTVLAYEIIKDSSPATHRNIENLANINQDGWHFDGEKFYRLDAIPVASMKNEFIAYAYCTVIDPIMLTYSSTIEEITDYCIVVQKDGEVLVQTPPIAGNLDSKNTQLSLFDAVQTDYYVNLSCLLKTCEALSRMYGGESIEVFDIPYYMIRHHTVNLTKLSIFVKDSSTTLLRPVEMISYLVGRLDKENDFNNAITLVKLIRRICRGGVVRASIADTVNVYTDKQVKLVDINAVINK